MMMWQIGLRDDYTVKLRRDNAVCCGTVWRTSKNRKETINIIFTYYQHVASSGTNMSPADYR
jgi:hypothetical protein